MITRLQLHNYRNLPDLDFAPQKENLIIAPNASGKSNLLESIYLTTFQRSFRPFSSLIEVIGDQDSFTKVHIQLKSGQDITQIISSTDKGINRQVLVNDKKSVAKTTLKLLPVILFAPHTVNLIAEDPAGRRQDLDDFLQIWDPAYTKVIKHYNQLLKNRNALLKHVRAERESVDTLDFWNKSLASAAVTVNKARTGLITQAAEFMPTVGEEIYRYSAELKIEYLPFHIQPQEEYERTIERQLTQNLTKEVAAGQTLYGPHRDDYAITVRGKNLRYMGSRGEQRLGALIWKLAQAECLSTKLAAPVTLLVDDLMSELDSNHRQRAAKYLINCPHQFWSTAADELDVPAELKSACEQISLS